MNSLPRPKDKTLPDVTHIYIHSPDTGEMFHRSLPLHELDKSEPSWVALFANLHRLQHSGIAQLLQHQLSAETVW